MSGFKKLRLWADIIQNDISPFRPDGIIMWSFLTRIISLFRRKLLLILMVRKYHSEFFWLKVKRFSEFYFTVKFWVFKLEMRFRMAGEDKFFQPPFFLPKKWRTKPQGFSSRFLRLAAKRQSQKLFTQKAQPFLHIFTKFQKPGWWSRSLWSLVKTFRLRSTCEVFSLRE